MLPHELHTKSQNEPLLTTSEETTEPVPVKLRTHKEDTSKQHPRSKMVTIPVSLLDFLMFNDKRWTLDPNDNPLLGDQREIFPELATLLQSLDPEEKLWHIEQPGQWNDRKRPVLYSRAAWNIQKLLLGVEHDARLKTLAAKELCDKKLQELISAFEKMTGSETIPNFRKHSENMMLNVLIHIDKIFASDIGVNLDEVTPEIIDLAYKNNPVYMKIKLTQMTSGS